MQGLLVTATDTGVGKTVLAAALCAVLRERGTAVAARKPVLSGLDEPGPHDHELLASCTGQRPEEVCDLAFGPAVSPHLAADMAGVELDVRRLTQMPAGADAVVVEGVGGLLVPLAPSLTVRDLAVRLGLPVVVAARPGLGTINHTLLTLEAARSAGLDVRAVVLTPWPAGPDAIEASNRAAIADLGGVPAEVLPQTALDPASLARAAAHLPVEAWLGPGSVTSQEQLEGGW